MIPLTQVRTARIRLPPGRTKWADFRRSGQSLGTAATEATRAVRVLPPGIAKLNIEADFLVPLQLDYPAVMDHKLDRAVANGLERLAQL